VATKWLTIDKELSDSAESLAKVYAALASKGEASSVEMLRHS